MTAAPDDPGLGRRPRSPQKRKARRRRKTVAAVSKSSLAKAALFKRITVTIDHVRTPIFVIEAIYRKLWISEMKGDQKALRVRAQYDRYFTASLPEDHKPRPEIRIFRNGREESNND